MDWSLFLHLPERLLPWYEGDNRTMPWRVPSPDPYWVLVSEIMLQQTRVETVIPYFTRFIQTLPDLQSLAEADEELLLKLWEGLGYYSRVRNLQKAAITAVEEFGGKLPASSAELRTLKGVGDYTAGAIASIAFGLPEPAVDGNVLRVTARYLDYHDDVLKPDFKAAVTEHLRKVYPKGQCSAFTQSLMDLGALICIPGNPRCEQCPLKNICLGFKHGTAPALPCRKEKTQRKIEKKTVFILHTDKKMAIRKRPSSGVLANMWELPWIDGFIPQKDLQKIFPDAQICLAGKGKHVFTHLEWHMQIWDIHVNAEIADYIWVTETELKDTYSLPSAFRKFIPD